MTNGHTTYARATLEYDEEHKQEFISRTFRDVEGTA